MADDDQIIVKVPHGERIEYGRSVSMESGDPEVSVHVEVDYEVLVVESGTGIISRDGVVQTISQGDRLTIPKGATYTLQSDASHRTTVIVFGVSKNH